MHCLYTLLIAVALALLVAGPLWAAEVLGEEGMFPFLVPSVGYWENATDLSGLNEKPAGAQGVIRVEDGHFVDGRGERIRFIGGALAFNACFPSHEMAEKLAGRLSMLGLNLVRLHHMDSAYAPRGIWDAGYTDKQHIDADQLDRLDYLIAQLKSQGVYCNVNLHVSRKFTEADGFPNAGELPRYDKGVDNFEPRMIELQKQYAKELLSHRNPHTGNRYVDEPAVAFVEINNENSLLAMVLRGQFPRLPEHYERQLVARWNEWLGRRYESTEKLRAAWGVIDEPLGDEILRNGDFATGADDWDVQSQDRTSVEVEGAGPEGGPALHLRFAGPGDVPWSMQVHQVHLDVKEGKPYTLEFSIRADRRAPVTVTARLDHAHPDTGRFEIIGLTEKLAATTKWQRHTYCFTAKGPRPEGNRVGFTFPNEAGEFWLANVSLRPGGRIGLEPGESLEDGSISRPMREAGLADRWRDWIECAAEIDRGYALEMYRYLKQDLGVKCPVIDTQANYGGIGGLYRESHLDYCDLHAYWQHPRFPRESWDMNDWEVGNSPMVAQPNASTVVRIAQNRIHGKPLVVSEFNHASPSYYAAEAWPLMASFAALQDWDGLVVHNYLNYGSDEWDSRHWNHFFDTATNPQKTPFLAAAAIMFRSGAVAPAPGEVRLQIPVEKLTELMGPGDWDAGGVWQQAGAGVPDALSDRLSVEFVPGGGEARLASEQDADRGPVQVHWEAEEPVRALYTVDAPAVKAAVGYLAGRDIELGAVVLSTREVRTGFAAIALVALDGKPIETSSRLLLSAVGRTANSGWKWREDGRMLLDWGGDPTLGEGISATVSLRTSAGGVQAYALDGAGNRKGPVACELRDGRVTLALDPIHQTLWYELACTE